MSNTTTTTVHDLASMRQAGQRVLPVAREVFADGESPVAIYRKLAADVPGSFLLESAEQGGIWSRFSFVGVSSFGVLTDLDGAAHWQNYGLAQDRAFGDVMPTQGLDAVRALYEKWAAPSALDIAPLTGGLVGFIGWEAVRQLENLPNAPVQDYDVPGQALSFVRELLVLDHKFGTVTLISNVLADDPQRISSPRLRFAWTIFSSDCRERARSVWQMSILTQLRMLNIVRNGRNTFLPFTSRVSTSLMVTFFRLSSLKDLKCQIPLTRLTSTEFCGA